MMISSTPQPQLVADAPMLPLPCVIEQRIEETQDTVTLVLKPPGGALPFAPGQFNMLYVFGMGEVPISISGDPEEPERLVHTIRGVGAVTRPLFALQPGDVIGVRGPFGTAWPVERANGKDLLIIAGGIGLAPLRPAIYHAIRHRDRYNKVLVLYGTRTPQDIVFDQQLLAWTRGGALSVAVTVDRADSSWRGRTGVVTRLIERAEFDPESCLAMLCGPEVMMRFSARELVRRGVQPTQLYVTLERNMQCAIAQCGHCQFGPELLCRDGAVYRYDRVARLFSIPQV